LSRRLLDNQMWRAESFTRGQAWVDMLLLANHKDGYILKRGIEVKVKRGQIGWSELALAKRWGWSRGKIRRFLGTLVGKEKIVQQKTNITNINDKNNLFLTVSTSYLYLIKFTLVFKIFDLRHRIEKKHLYTLIF